MQKLFVVGFTTDLRGLVLSRQKGVKSGGFVVALDDQFRRTIDEVFRRHAPGSPPEPVPVAIPPRVAEAPAEPGGDPEAAPEATETRRNLGRGVLTPKEIQAELRAGKSVQDVARIAGTDVSWIERFLSPILAERKGIVDAVMGGVISRPRRGRSGCTVGEAILAYLRDHKVTVDPEEFDEGWEAVRRGGQWEVTFRCPIKGQVKEAQFTYETETGVKPANPMASEMAWRSADPGRGTERAEEPADGDEPAPDAETPAAPPVKRRASPKAAAAAAGRRDAAASTASLWGATKVTPPTAPARRTSFIGAGKADGAAASATKPAPKPGAGPKPGRGPGAQPASGAAGRTSEAAARTPGRQPPPLPAKRLPGAADDRPVFARNSSSPRPKRLITAVDDEATWRSAVARTRQARRGDVAPQPPPQPPRPQKADRKRLPDDWLLDD